MLTALASLVAVSLVVEPAVAGVLLDEEELLLLEDELLDEEELLLLDDDELLDEEELSSLETDSADDQSNSKMAGSVMVPMPTDDKSRVNVIGICVAVLVTEKTKLVPLTTLSS